MENTPGKFTAKEIAEKARLALEDKKGKDIKVLYVEDKTVIAEYFVLCSGSSVTQIRALANEVEFQLNETGIAPAAIEGRDNNSWWILDYSHVLVHIFSREAREFYNLDKLYAEEAERASGSLPTETETDDEI